MTRSQSSRRIQKIEKVCVFYDDTLLLHWTWISSFETFAMSLLICFSLSISFNMWNDIHSNISWERKSRNSHQNSIRTISCCHLFSLQIIDVFWRWSKNCAWCKIDLFRLYVICFVALIHELYLLFIFISCWKSDQIKSLRAIVRLSSSRSSSIFVLLYIYINFCFFLSQFSQSHLSTRRSKHI